MVKAVSFHKFMLNWNILELLLHIYIIGVMPIEFHLDW